MLPFAQHRGQPQGFTFSLRRQWTTSGLDQGSNMPLTHIKMQITNELHGISLRFAIGSCWPYFQKTLCHNLPFWSVDLCSTSAVWKVNVFPTAPATASVYNERSKSETAMGEGTIDGRCVHFYSMYIIYWYEGNMIQGFLQMNLLVLYFDLMIGFNFHLLCKQHRQVKHYDVWLCLSCILLGCYCASWQHVKMCALDIRWCQTWCATAFILYFARLLLR